MKEVKYFIHNGSAYIEPYHAPLNKIGGMLLKLESRAREAMVAAEASHVVYAVKKFNKDGEVDLVDFYDPPVCMNDHDFDKRIDALSSVFPGCIIYALHAIK